LSGHTAMLVKFHGLVRHNRLAFPCLRAERDSSPKIWAWHGGFPRCAAHSSYHEPEAVPDQCDPGDGDTSRVPGIGNRPTVITMTPREPVSLLNVVIWLRGNSVMDAADLIRAR
jgi:hypothetical protein